jgi:hypothetical protein
MRSNFTIKRCRSDPRRAIYPRTLPLRIPSRNPLGVLPATHQDASTPDTICLHLYSRIHPFQQSSESVCHLVSFSSQAPGGVCRPCMTAWALVPVVVTPRSLLARAGFIDFQVPAFKLSTIQFTSCLLRCFVVSKLHETKTTGSAGVPVSYNLSGYHLAIRRKQRVKRLLLCPVAQIPNV